MSRAFPIPYIIYWLLVKDFFYNVDVCDSSNNEPGHCLSDSECSNIGTSIGSCESDSPAPVCCKITFNYFNETYLLKQIFIRKSQTDVVREMVIFSSDTACGESFLHYGNKSINLKKKEKVYFIPEVHISETPDRIIWPIWASYSRKSRDLKWQSFGTNHLYVVELNKLVADESDNTSHTVSECFSESDEDDKFYTLLNYEKRFPIRNFFSPKMQKFNTMNLTIDVSSFIEEIEEDTRSRRSADLGVNKLEDLSCEKQQWEDLFYKKDSTEIEDIQSELEISHQFFEQMDNSDSTSINRNQNNDSVNSLMKSKDVLAKQMKRDDINGDPPTSKENIDTNTTNESVFKEQFSDSGINSDVLEEKRTVGIKETNPFNKFPIEEDSSYELNRQMKLSVYGNMQSQESEVIGDFRKPVQFEAAHDMRNSVQLEITHDMRKPVQVDDTHDMRKSVKVDATRDMQKSVTIESSHDMRTAVQNTVHHNMRKPVEIGRGTVQREGSHDMRKPVTSDESHDLRWPVVEEENDLRNLYGESGTYENVNLESSDSKISQRKLNDSIRITDADVNLTLHNSFQDCKNYISLFSKKVFSTHNPTEKKQKQLKDLWEEASRVCGKYNEVTAESNSSVTEAKWPWMVSLHENISGRYVHKCSASLLNSLWVITVAHCVDMKPMENVILILGNQNLKDGKQSVTERAVDEIIIHPKFNRGLFENDIALLRMKTPVTIESAISPICLPWNVQEHSHGIPVFLGRKQKDQRTTDLQDLTVPIMNNYECDILYSTGKNKEKLKDTFLCAGKDDRNCDSESGSSLIALDSERRWSLIGLVSWGSMCTNSEQPAVYMRISSYARWIKAVIDCYEILM